LELIKTIDMNIWIILIAVMVASFIIQQTLQSRFRKYSQIPTPGGLTGAEVARRMLEANGITNVRITSVEGQLTDHFNPETMTVNLSEAVYGQRSIAAAAVAAHECGHVLQHAQGYAPLRLRSKLVPVVTFANRTVQWVILLGVLLINITPSLLWIGIALFAASTLFSFVTLPVEVNASQRAVAWLKDSRITDVETAPMAQDALKWAAYTYVIAAIGSLATLLYYIGMARRN
jgi:Zn-dependent membrane protease YugP